MHRYMFSKYVYIAIIDILFIVCPVGEYLSMANAECRVCPGNSEGTVSGLTVCPCVDGYYRAEGEEDRECTRKQLVMT